MPQREFHFQGPPVPDFSESNSTAGTVSGDIHPIELVVQSVLGGSLESLSTQLQSLHESQVVLIARLRVIEERLKRCDAELAVDVDVKSVEDRLVTVKKRLQVILATLVTIEKRLREKKSQNGS